LDRSVLLSACGSDRSLSRLVDELAPDRGWLLISAFNCHAETAKNIMKLGAQVALRWPEMQPQIEWVPKALTSKTPLLLVERR
jgi:hypothetical protein